MSNFRSLRPATRALLAVATVSAGVLALPAAGTPASAATVSAGSVSSTPTSVLALHEVAARRAATRAERLRRERRREHRREMRERRRERRHHRRIVRTHKTFKAFEVGVDQKGDPYVYGATGPGSFDCSGLTSYAYKRAGLHLPRTSAAQAGAVRHISRKDMKRGDLIFFSSGGHVYHVGMFAGRRHGTDYILHAPYPGRSVTTEAIWTNDWFAGTVR
jgi:cell wall-associated NlpC family hydrolase